MTTPFSSNPALGGSDIRSESFDKVTGKTNFVEDFKIPGMLHARVLRSPYHHARLNKLDVVRAAQMPGVRRILTWMDIPNVNGFPSYSLEEPVLTPVGDTLRMRGAPIALVVAESTQQAQAALEAVEMELESLPYTFEMEEALKPGALHIAGEGNVLSKFLVNQGDLEAALRASEHVVEAAYETAFLEHVALERESLLGMIDEEGRVTVIGGTHQPHMQQGFIAEMLGLPRERVRVIVPPMGGSFGGKQDPWPFAAVGLAVYYVRQPIRLIYSREESFDASPKRHPYHVKFKIGASQAGELTGIQMRIDCNTGGYDGAGRFIANYAVTAAGGAYRWQAADIAARSVYTNGPKAGQYRGFGTAQSTFALECGLDEIIQELGDDPIEFRLRNCLGPTDVSFLGYPLADSLGYSQVLNTIAPHYRQYLLEAETYNETHAQGYLRRGVGLAGMWYRFGKAGSLKIEAQAELAADGHFVVYCSAPDYGQGTNTVMSQIAADTLGVGREYVQVINADTARVPDSDIQGASRATFFVGGAIQKAAGILMEAVFGVAAELLDVPVHALKVQPDQVVARDNDQLTIPLVEVAREFDRIGKSRRVAGYFDITDKLPKTDRPEYLPLFVTGAQLAEVEVDMETGLVQVRRVTAVHDLGRVVNPLDAAGQIQGAIVMGLGAALHEQYLPGQTTGLSQYLAPMADSMPEINVIFVEVPSRLGPYGVKGLGEAAMLPSTPAIINAVSRAVGARVRSIPATPERILAAMQASKGPTRE